MLNILRISCTPMPQKEVRQGERPILIHPGIKFTSNATKFASCESECPCPCVHVKSRDSPFGLEQRKRLPKQ